MGSVTLHKGFTIATGGGIKEFTNGNGAIWFFGDGATGYNGIDVKFLGTTANNYMFWDESANSLILAASGISMTGAHTNAFSFTGTVGTATDGTVIKIGTSAAWINHATAGQCLIKALGSNSATSGDYATLRMRARSDAAGATVCGNFSASAGANDHGNLIAVQGYAQPNTYTQASASHISCGLYSCIDATAASSGRRWSTWIDDHSTTKASGGHYMLRISQNGSVEIDGAITVYTPRLPMLFNFEEIGGFLGASTAAENNTHRIAVNIVGVGTRYIKLSDA